MVRLHSPSEGWSESRIDFGPKSRLVAAHSSPLNSIDTYTNYQGLRVLTLALILFLSLLNLILVSYLWTITTLTKLNCHMTFFSLSLRVLHSLTIHLRQENFTFSVGGGLWFTNTALHL